MTSNLARLFVGAIIALSVLVGGVGAATAQETHVVKMLNKDPDNPRNRNVFVPAIVYAKPGDTIKFEPTDSGHNAQTIKGMLPDGAEAFKSKILRKGRPAYEVVVQKPGVYGYKCLPHYALGMVGLIVVEGEGVEESLEKAKAVKQRGRAKKNFEAIFAEVKIPAAS